MATLFNTKISATYPGLIKTIDNIAISATLRQLTDGSGNSSGLFLNNAGDFKVTSILEWGSLKDTGTGVTITQFVTAANGIGNFNNDTTIPTSAAVKNYVDAVVTASDLDFLGDSNTGTPAVDLDSQKFSILGTTNQIVTSGNAQALTIALPNSVIISGTYTGATFAGDLNGTINTATTAITQTAGDNSTKVATTAYVDSLDAASDLDFSGDSGTGDVTLNTQVLAITGTTNQIVTTAANQGLSLSLPSTVHRNLQGNVIGNVDGNLTGNVTATSVLVNGVSATTQSSSDSSTKVATTAYVKGLNNASDLDFTTDSGSGAVVLNTETFSVLGTTNQINSAGSGQAITLSLPATIHRNLLGNVTGDLTGNADTATAWETARNLSVTGEATGTLLNVNGTQPVSGAVTLDNNSVTGKVLTGLPTPAASTVLPADSILDGIGKLQSQINGLANGLQFQGGWNATANSPLLGSGGGEAASGTTSSTTANKLVDSNANFTSTVTVGDKVINQVDRQTSLVTNIDSNTILSLASDIMLTGEAYTIDNSPFITQGHYYVVNEGGSTNLNGISNWSVGDWVIAGATNVWEKLDHTDVEGTGTPGNIAKWLDVGTLQDSIMAESGAAITVTGSLSTTTNLNSGSNFAVNTNKFTANGTTGNVAILGDLAINTNKFTVNATNGNTLVAGNVTISGTGTSTINGDLVLQPTKKLYLDGGNDTYITEVSANLIGFNTGGGQRLAIGVNESTFAGNITFGDSHFIGDDASDNLLIQSSTGENIIIDSLDDILFRNSGVTQLQIKDTGSTFAGNVKLLGILELNDVAQSIDFLQSGAINFDSNNDQTGRVLTIGSGRTGGSGGTTNVTFSEDGNSTFAGQLGIGGSPSHPLDVKGADTNNATIARFYSNIGQRGSFIIRNGSGVSPTTFIGTSGGSEQLSIGTNNTEAIGIDGSQNVTIAGILTAGTIVGAASTFDPMVTITYSDISTGENRGLRIVNTQGTEQIWNLTNGITGNNNEDFCIRDSTNNVNAFTLAKTSGNAEFSGSGSFADDVSVNNKIEIYSDGTLNWGAAHDSGRLTFDTDIAVVAGLSGKSLVLRSGGSGSGNTALTLDTSQNATFTGAVGIGTTGVYSTDRDLNLSGKGLSIKNNVNGSNNNWSYIHNTATGSSSNLVLQTGNAAALTLSHTGNATFLKPTTIEGIVADSNFPIYRTKISAPFSGGWNTLTPGTTIGGIQQTNVRSDTLQNNISASMDFYLENNIFGTGRTGISFKCGGVNGADSTEKMRITSDGELLKGITSAAGQGTLADFNSSEMGNGYINLCRDDTATIKQIRFGKNGTEVGSISTTGSATAFNTSSDYRLKEDLQDFAGLDMVSKIPVYDFKWKTDESRSYGVMAHELEEVLPQAVNGEKDAKEMQSVDYSKIVPLLVKSIQELSAKVEKLEQECKCK